MSDTPQMDPTQAAEARLRAALDAPDDVKLILAELTRVRWKCQGHASTIRQLQMQIEEYEEQFIDDHV